MKKLFTISILCFVICTAQTQTLFRSGIFLHHSTGLCIWGPNGSTTGIPEEMSLFNDAHSLTGADSITLTEEWWSPSDNEWATQHDFFEDPSAVTGIGYYLPTNKIIVIKSCFPSSSLSGVGQPSDTLNPTDKTIYNYKWHWRHIINIMRSHPENFFAIWTNAPLEPNSTNATEAALSDDFCTWAKDTLAQGNDPVFGAFPDNVYVFDFFHKLTDVGGIMQSFYATGSGDSHPNAAATALVAPQFVQEIFDAALFYETLYSGIQETTPTIFSVRFDASSGNIIVMLKDKMMQEKCNFTLYDLTGRIVSTFSLKSGVTVIPCESTSKGIMLYNISSSNKNFQSGKIGITN
ncbi:MAG: hypothetical protein V2A54_05040 [Bacteroidota bacterium]